MTAISTSSVIRVGHKGADGIVPGNTTASFDAALAAGVQMIEFDVISEHADGSGELLIAHDYGHTDGAPTLAQVLAHFSTPEFADIGLDVDLKLRGYELRVVEALQAAGFAKRTLISSTYRSSLARVAAADPDIRRGWSVPRLHHDPTQSPWTRYPTLLAALVYRTLLPRLAARELRGGAAHALMSQWRLITPALVAAVTQAGGELYAWTVDDRIEIERLGALGVTGVITNDPRLFGSAQGSEQAAAL